MADTEGKITRDPEISAIVRIEKALSALPDEARARIVNYLASRYCPETQKCRQLPFGGEDHP